MGLELQYDAQLTGRNGTILTAKNAWGYDMPTHYSTLQDAVPGNDITLTIRRTSSTIWKVRSVPPWRSIMWRPVRWAL